MGGWFQWKSRPSLDGLFRRCGLPWRKQVVSIRATVRWRQNENGHQDHGLGRGGLQFIRFAAVLRARCCASERENRRHECRENNPGNEVADILHGLDVSKEKLFGWEW